MLPTTPFGREESLLVDVRAVVGFATPTRCGRDSIGPRVGVGSIHFLGLVETNRLHEQRFSRTSSSAFKLWRMVFIKVCLRDAVT
jgi:hypothetical protein